MEKQNRTLVPVEISFPDGHTRKMQSHKSDCGRWHFTGCGTFEKQENGEYRHVTKLDGTWTLKELEDHHGKAE